MQNLLNLKLVQQCVIFLLNTLYKSALIQTSVFSINLNPYFNQAKNKVRERGKLGEGNYFKFKECSTALT